MTRTLEETLRRIDGKGYKAYKDIAGAHRLGELELRIDHVQGDPFAPPSRLRAIVPWEAAALPDAARSSDPRRRAARDFIARGFARAAGRDEAVQIDAGRQTVLDRTAVLFTGDGVELRFTVALPARGRTVLGRSAAELLCRRLPAIVQESTHAGRLDLDALIRHCEAVEDQDALRRSLGRHGLIAFVGDGSMLPRRSGVDDRPLTGAVPFEAPASRRVTLTAPNAGEITGLGVPGGITLIVGGGFHGKSTLMNAIEQGVYDHVPGDGREHVVTDPDATKIRAEDGRAVHAVDLSPYINHLPQGKSTTSFSTELASGSTSQAAALQEAREAGAATLLIDEDTSATNFMIRDERMQALVAKDHEPITPFIDRVRQLRDTLGVSTLLVMGGSGDYFDSADTVLQMHEYRPLDVTREAHEIARTHETGRREETETPLSSPRTRALETGSLDPSTRKGKRRIQARGRDALTFGEHSVDLNALEQLADASQVRAIGSVLARMGGLGGRLEDPPDWVRERVEREDWMGLHDRPDGDLARPRTMEVMAVLNRLRGARLARG